MRVGAARESSSRDHDATTEGDSRAAAVLADVSHLKVVRQSVTTGARMAPEQILPVAAALEGLLPSAGLQRGTNLAVHGVGATSFALAMMGEAVRSGAFLAVVAPTSFSLASCADFAIPMRRVVQFVLPDDAGWGQAVAAIIEGFDLVVVADRHRVRSAEGRQLLARSRERGSVLARVGGQAWSDAPDLRFDLREPTWVGLGQGHGHLQARRLDVQVAGRRHQGPPQIHQVLVPALGGGVALASSVEAIKPVDTDVAVAVHRFAGSDIDAMLDAVDGDASVSASSDSSAAGQDDAAGGDAHLSATA